MLASHWTQILPSGPIVLIQGPLPSGKSSATVSGSPDSGLTVTTVSPCAGRVVEALDPSASV